MADATIRPVELLTLKVRTPIAWALRMRVAIFLMHCAALVMSTKIEIDLVASDRGGDSDREGVVESPGGLRG